MKPFAKSCLIVVAVMLAMLVSCGRKEARSILPEGCELKAGDLVFRRGNGITSRVVVTADRHGAYSHVGIVVDSCGTPMVVHAVPDEPDYPGDPDRVKMETPEKFYSSINARIGEVRRYTGKPETAAEAARQAVEVYRRGVLFDHDYDDADTTKMYCCELINFAYAKAGATLVDSAVHEVNLPGLHIRCIMPSDICNNAMMRKIISF